VTLQVAVDLGATDRKIGSLLLGRQVWRAPIDKIAILPDPSASQLGPAVGIPAPCTSGNQAGARPI
jgi:hypothetical protein